MICPKCGNTIDGSAVFCPKCGSRATSTENAAPAPTRVSDVSTAQQAQSVAPNSATQAPGNKKKGSWLPLIAIVAVIAIAIFFFGGGNGGQQQQRHTLETDTTQEQLQEWADSLVSYYGIIPCTTQAGVSGNTLYLRATLTISIDTLLGGDYMRYYQGLGVDQMLAQSLFTEATVNALSQTIATWEQNGYSNSQIVWETFDRDGNSLLYRVFTSKG